MPLIDLLLRSTLGANRAPESLTVALFAGSREIKDQAYRRAEVRKGGWAFHTDRDGKVSAQTMVRFGPFLETSSFDAAVLMRGDEVIEIVPFSDGVQAPAATVYEHTYIAEFWKA